MLRLDLETRLIAALTRQADRAGFVWVVAGVAAAATLSMTVPFASMLITAVLIAPRRWIWIALASSVGAALGAALLYVVFHHLGWARLFELYPDVVRSAAWSDATRWLTRYGTVSLLLIAALPLPLTPALMFAAIHPLPVVHVLLALWAGKLAKYLVYAWLAWVFPARVLRYGHIRIAALDAVLKRASSAREPTPSHAGGPQA